MPRSTKVTAPVEAQAPRVLTLAEEFITGAPDFLGGGEHKGGRKRLKFSNAELRFILWQRHEGVPTTVVAEQLHSSPASIRGILWKAQRDPLLLVRWGVVMPLETETSTSKSLRWACRVCLATGPDLDLSAGHCWRHLFDPAGTLTRDLAHSERWQANEGTQ